MENRLKTLIEFIKAITGRTTEEVADSINYSRVHLTTEMKKEDGNPSIEKILQNKYRKEMEEFFEDRSLILGEPGEDYGKNFKIVDAEQLLVKDSILLKGMMRVMLRNQAYIIAVQTKKPVSSVLKEITKAVEAETQEEFGEL